MVAPTVKDWALMVVLEPMVAMSPRLTRLSATAAPTPTLEVPAAVPEAVDVSPNTGSALLPVPLPAVTTRGPSAVMERPAGIVALTWLLARFRATAAATVTPPSEVEAEGVCASFEVLSSPADFPLESLSEPLSLSAYLRCWLSWPLTESGSWSELDASSEPTG